ncbi:type IV toxin-antitoxin system AbiEi family antitoxin domain-containing protein [Sphingobium sp. H39-3-25]|uniref:type IV toxin-antitoxin system AbiEi family antitoxin domain-containing protein n=1 Tax=Sphingobium arseniciresistens TaxID=3030834 RepID=UPI0023B9B7C5|nr:type IV toxin-antitoxin system AbiEi family antitoxin domain-containing protein [Sphingobium arseniciresistens]
MGEALAFPALEAKRRERLAVDGRDESALLVRRDDVGRCPQAGDDRGIEQVEGQKGISLMNSASSMSATWREERAGCQRRIDVLHNAEDAYVEDGIALLNLGRKAHTTFSLQSPSSKNSALNLLVLNSTWANGQLHVTFREPFDMLEEIGSGNPPAEPPTGSGGSGVSSWLPFQDTSKTILLFLTDEARKTISRFRAVGRSSLFKCKDEAVTFVSDAPLASIREPTHGIRKRERDRAERIRLAGGPKPSLRQRAVALAQERGEVRTKDLTDIGVHRCYLSRMCDEGLLVKVGFGRYRAASSG